MTLPSGSVTFLFTDIEGSTRLLEELGDVWATALAEHNRLIREGIATLRGHEVDRQGDAFFIVFEQAADAVAAARELQAALADHPWPGDADLRVRMGIHSGEVTLGPEGYVGVDVHRGARICAAAHGGQVLLSQATLELLGDAQARDLGEHRLKDLTKPVRLYQLLGHGLESDFPPPRSLDATNLPVQHTPLVDREDEVATTVALIRGDAAKLVTLTGPGGTGKTRIALQTAAELVGAYRDGVFFVPLAPVANAADVESVVALAIGAPVEGNGLVRFVRDRELLLVLDNFEHLLDGVPLVTQLLSESPGLHVLVTSRAPLHLSSEHELPVQPLADQHALALLTERARSARPDFEPDEAARQLCARLEGMPLAIELAAARLKHLTADALLARLNHSLDLLSGGARDLPERQRTLRATIEWSYRLLQSDEQLLFERLSVFAGGWTLVQAEAVCSLPADDGLDVLDGIASLVDKSLVYWTAAADQEPRYFMHVTIAEYALERLRARGEEDTFRRRHRDHFRDLVESVRPIATLSGIRTLRPERENLRAALGWSIDAGDGEDALRIAYRLWRYWTESGSLREGRRWLDEALAAVDVTGTVLEARALDASAFLAAQQGDFETAVPLLDASEEIARGAPGAWLALGWCLFRRGQFEIDRGRLESAEDPLREAEAVFHANSYGIGVAWALIELGRCRLLSGDAPRRAQLLPPGDRGRPHRSRADRGRVRTGPGWLDRHARRSCAGSRGDARWTGDTRCASGELHARSRSPPRRPGLSPGRRRLGRTARSGPRHASLSRQRRGPTRERVPGRCSAHRRRRREVRGSCAPLGSRRSGRRRDRRPPEPAAPQPPRTARATGSASARRQRVRAGARSRPVVHARARTSGRHRPARRAPAGRLSQQLGTGPAGRKQGVVRRRERRSARRTQPPDCSAMLRP